MQNFTRAKDDSGVSITCTRRFSSEEEFTSESFNPDPSTYLSLVEAPEGFGRFHLSACVRNLVLPRPGDPAASSHFSSWSTFATATQRSLTLWSEAG